MPYTYCLLAAGTFLWCLPFVLARTRHRDPSQLDRRARWGIALQCISYSLLWQGRFWERHPQGWQFALAIACFALACGLSWTGSRALGRHLQLDAALDPAHRLVQSGPYRFIRHPIYTSMLCVLMGTGVLIAPSTSWRRPRWYSWQAPGSACGLKTESWPRGSESSSPPTAIRCPVCFLSEAD